MPERTALPLYFVIGLQLAANMRQTFSLTSLLLYSRNAQLW